ncbi:MAG: hypothetical protein ACYSVY_08960 [Planctomycetota bacterium]
MVMPGDVCLPSVAVIEALIEALGGRVDSPAPDDALPGPTLHDIPPLNKVNGKWVAQTEAAGITQRTTGILRNDRSRGQKAADELSGRDRHGRIWRKESRDAQKVWHLKSTLTQGQMTAE